MAPKSCTATGKGSQAEGGKGYPRKGGGKGKAGKGAASEAQDIKVLQEKLKQALTKNNRLEDSQKKLSAKVKELSKPGEKEVTPACTPGGVKPVEPPQPKMLNTKLQWVTVAWTCHACGQQHWAANKKACATCGTQRDPDAWTVISAGQGVGPQQTPTDLPGRLANHRSFFHALGTPLEPSGKGKSKDVETADLGKPEEEMQVETDAPPESDPQTKLAKVREVLKTMEDIGNEPAKQALLKQVKELEKAAKPAKEQQVTDVTNPLRVAQRATQALAEAREDRAKRVEALTRTTQAYEEQISKLQSQLAEHQAMVKHAEDEHARHLVILQEAITKANAQAKAQGLLTEDAAKTSDPGREVQQFQKALEIIYPAAVEDATLKEMGITKDMLDFIFKGQLLTAHQMSIQAELEKKEPSRSATASSPPSSLAELTPVGGGA